VTVAQLIVMVVAVGLGSIAFLGSVYVLFLAWVGSRTAPLGPSLVQVDPRSRFLVLVPAHNEEDGIQPTLKALAAMAYPRDLFDVIVVADNCSDNTASVVRETGTECWVRQDEQLRGKGQALRWAMDRARELEFDAIVVIDADTEPHPDLLLAFSQALAQGHQAIQIRYDFATASENAISTSTVIGKNAESTLFWRPRARLGLSVFLQGNGFCISKELLAKLPWSAYSIVEDIEYSIGLAIRQVRVAYLESANVVARSVSCGTTATPQRLRWASGTFQILFRYVPRLLIEAVRQRSLYLAEIACALLFLSRMLLVYATIGTLALSFLVPSPLALWIRVAVTMTLVLQSLYLGLVVRTCTPPSTRRSGVTGIPMYLGWLCLVQFMALLKIRRNVWTRTVR
jgi:1,2-diacylglycerol 3-beta-glucosyltransferase